MGIVTDLPLCQEPEKLYKIALRIQTRTKTYNKTSSSTDFFQRLQIEVNGIVRQQIENIHSYICIKDNSEIDYTFWKVILQVREILKCKINTKL